MTFSLFIYFKGVFFDVKHFKSLFEYVTILVLFVYVCFHFLFLLIFKVIIDNYELTAILLTVF